MVADNNGGRSDKTDPRDVPKTEVGSGLEGLFVDDGRAAARKAKREARVKTRPKKLEGLTLTEDPVEKIRRSEDPSTRELRRWSTIQFRLHFERCVPKHITLLDTNDPKVDFIFAHLLRDIRFLNDDPRVLYRCLRSIAKEAVSEILLESENDSNEVSIKTIVSLRGKYIITHLKKVTQKG